MSQRFGWGHININVKDLDVSVRFYQKLGFEPFISGIPYLNLTSEQNKDRGLVRLCLISQDLTSDYEHLKGQGVEFLSPPQPCHQRMADVATCVDPDGSLIELLQVYLDRWPPMTSPGPSNGSKT